MSWDAALLSGRPSWMTDKNLLQRKGWAWLKGLMAFILTGWLISHYSSRMGASEGNSGKCLILSNTDYLERSFYINPTLFAILLLNCCRESFLISLWRFFRISAIRTPQFNARSQILSHLRVSNLLGPCWTLSHSQFSHLLFLLHFFLLPPPPPLFLPSPSPSPPPFPHVFWVPTDPADVLGLGRGKISCKRKNRDCYPAALLGSRGFYLIATWITILTSPYKGALYFGWVSRNRISTLCFTFDDFYLTRL